MIPLFKNKLGEKSLSMTFAIIAFVAVTAGYVMSLFNIHEFDNAAAASYLIPVLTLYFGRKYTSETKDSQ